LASATLARGGEAAGLSLMEKSDCLACHQPDKKTIGPSFRDIAGKYGEADIPTLVKKVKEGGSGNWGEIPMPPHADLPDESVGKMLAWILSHDKAGSAAAAGAEAAAVYPGTKPGDEAPAYRTVPRIGSRVVIWVVAQLHLMFAAFVLAVPMFALI